MLTTFKVSPVEVNTKRLPTVSLRSSLSTLTNSNIEAAGAGPGKFIETETNGFIQAVHTAFDQHYPLVLSPDDIWLCIAQGVSTHVNQNAEALRGQFVNFDGKKEIRVRRDDFVKGSEANDWAGAIGEFSNGLEQFISKKAELLLSNFSTSGVVEKTASQICLMSTMQQYFKFTLETRCGIPNITLLGTAQDWRNIRARAEALAEFKLQWWVPTLLKVLDQFVLAGYGKADEEFWQSFYKECSGSGRRVVNGWINVLFPYVEGYDKKVRQNPFASTLEMNQYSGANKGAFPLGLSEAPFTWEYLTSVYPMQLLGGFVGATQTEEGAIRPAIGWAVREAK
jgi:hypothetical protein